MPPEEQRRRQHDPHPPHHHHHPDEPSTTVLPNAGGGGSGSAAEAGLVVTMDDEHHHQQHQASTSSSDRRGVSPQQQQHLVMDNDDDDDDDDSYHDLDAVLALMVAAAASESEQADESNANQSAAAAAAAARGDAAAPGAAMAANGNPFDSAAMVDAAAAVAAPPSSRFSSPSSSSRRLPPLVGRTASSEEESKEEIENDDREQERDDDNSNHNSSSGSIPHRYASATYTAAPIEEAAVLLESVAYSASLQQSQHDEDARLAAAAAEEEELLLALKRSAYEGRYNSNSYDYDDSNTAAAAAAATYYNNSTGVGGGDTNAYGQAAQQEATVLEITDERYDAGAAAAYSERDGYSYMNSVAASASAATTAHAEWIGQDYSNNNNNSNSNATTATTNNTSSSSSSTNDNTGNRAAAAIAVSDEAEHEGYYDQTTTATEAMVIDSAPLEKNQDGFTEEAQVLLEEEQQQEEDEEDSKPAARGNSGGGGPRDDEEAEVLGIQERGDIHPVEFAAVDASQDAELVRTDYSYTVALPSSTGAASTAESASVMAATSNNSNDVEDAVSPSPQQTAATPQAMAVVAPSVAPQLDDVATNLTTASAVHDEDTPFLNTEQGEQDIAPVEHAQVLESESSDASVQEDDVKPDAADDSPDRNGLPPQHPSPRMRRSLSAIAEQEGQVVSIQEDRDLHPVVRAENRQCGSEAEFLGTDVNTTASAAPRTPQATAVSATRSFADADYSGSVDHPDASSSPGGDDEAQVVSIQDVQDLHPAADDREHRSSGVDAELVGEAPAAATLVCNDDQGHVFTEPPVVADTAFPSSLGHSHPQTTATWVNHSPTSPAAAAASQPAVQAASVFVDPHQPHAPPPARRCESDDDLRAALAAIEAMEQGEHQKDSSPMATTTPDKAGPSVQDAGDSRERGQSDRQFDGVDDEYSLDRLRDTAASTTPDQQRIGSGTNETSNGSSATGSTRGTIHSVSRSTAAGIQQLSNNIARSTSTVLEALFGDVSSPFAKRSARGEDLANAIFSRTLLPWSVIHNRATGMWIATLQTNQKALDKKNVVAASKSLRAFSMPTEHQATCLAKAWTPPRMLPFENYKSCHLCGKKFAMFRRACHCRNCGVCVCKDCVVAWPSKMVPETFLTKKSNFVNACRSCDWLSTSFRVALLEGDLDKAVAIYGTGNVNLHTPFCNVKGELFYPVHCAVLGGNIDCLKFLVDSNCCPIKSVRVSGSGNSSKFTPIVTSKGRSLLGIAMEKENIEMIRYLVLHKGAVLSGEIDITSEMLAKNLERVLRILPEDAITRGVADPLSPSENNHNTSRPESSPLPMGGHFEGLVPLPPNQHGFDADDNARSLSEEARDFGAVKGSRRENQDNESEEQVNEECIICFDGTIDCCAVPCGHQCCCERCSTNLNSRCPVCSAECSFMRVYKP